MKIELKAARRGLTMIEVMAMIAVLGLLAALLLPALLPFHNGRMRVYCVNNLKQIGLAFKLWAGDNNDKYPMQVSVTNGGTMELVKSGVVYAHFLVMSNELATPKLVVCPEDKARTYAKSFDQNFSDRNVSYFVGVDADLTNPAMILAGDDNLTVGGTWTQRGLLALGTNAPVAWTAKRHVNCGNVVFADDSVQLLNTEQLRDVFARTGVATNRLAMP
jgi:hypothetical protein